MVEKEATFGQDEDEEYMQLRVPLLPHATHITILVKHGEERREAVLTYYRNGRVIEVQHAKE